MIFAVEVKSFAGQRVDWRRWAPPRGAPVATVPSPGTGFPLKVKPLQKLGGGGGGGGGGTASPLPYVQDEELVIPVSVVGAALHGREETPTAAFFLLGGVDQHSAAAGGLVSASPAVHLFCHRDMRHPGGGKGVTVLVIRMRHPAPCSSTNTLLMGAGGATPPCCRGRCRGHANIKSKVGPWQLRLQRRVHTGEIGRLRGTEKITPSIRSWKSAHFTQRPETAF